MVAPSPSDAPHTADASPGASRAFAGGVLMGLANLVPGVSGGTMILALGLYDRFIGAVAELTRLRPRRSTLIFLAIVGVGLVVSVLALAGPAVWLVTHHRWIAYSLFIGMTLGGVPMLWHYARPFGVGEGISIAAGVLVMTGVAFGLRDASLPHTALVFVVIGAIAASSMILPGISGSYILLIFGLYDVVIGSLRPSALRDDWKESLGIIVPVGIGVVLGIGLLSNVLKLVLAKYERPAHCALLGLLLGSVLGLWPYQEAVHPDLVTKDGVKAVEVLVEGGTTKDVLDETGVELTEDEARELAERYAGKTRGDLKLLGLQLERYDPPFSRIALALLLLGAGFGLTSLLGKKKD